MKTIIHEHRFSASEIIESLNIKLSKEEKLTGFWVSPKKKQLVITIKKMEVKKC